MAFARKRGLPADVTFCPTHGEVGRETDAIAIRSPKPRPGILSRHRDGRNQRQEREQAKNQIEWAISVAVQHRTSEAQNVLNSSSEGFVILGFAMRKWQLTLFSPSARMRSEWLLAKINSPSFARRK